jgi:hypothetical protein
MILRAIYAVAVGGFALYGLLTALGHAWARADGWLAMRRIRRDPMPEWMRLAIAQGVNPARVVPDHPSLQPARRRPATNVVVPFATPSKEH